MAKSRTAAAVLVLVMMVAFAVVFAAAIAAPVGGAFRETPLPLTPQQPGTPAGTILLCEAGDPYAPLAEEIAREEGLAVAQSWAEALEADPLYILWVVAAERLSDPAMVRAGLALRQHKTLPAVGMITGSSLEQARALWERGKVWRLPEADNPQIPETDSPQQAETASSQPVGAARGGWLYAANGEHPTAGVDEAHLIAFRAPEADNLPGAGELPEADDLPDAGAGPEPYPMTVGSLAEALAQADYLSYSGHGAGRSWNLAEGARFFAKDLPPDLPATVVGTSACQTFRPWVEDSILMGFLEHGAAGYTGFVYSPMAGYMVGEFSSLPFRYTWPEFPIGRVTAIQAQATLQSFAAFPYYYLAGDPRMALNAQPPYSVLSDSEQNGQRTVSYSALEAGMAPVRVSGGAKYTYVEIPGAGGAANGDPFFNARVQMMDDQGDKYILFDHPGGPFSVRLRESPPWHWRVTRPLLDAFDDVVLFTPQNGGDVLVIAAGLAALGIGLWRRWRRRADLGGGGWRLVLACLGVGAGAALALGVYGALRLPHAAIVTKALAVSFPWLLGAGLCAAAGLLLYASARGWPGKTLAVLAATFPALLPGLFLLGAAGGFNLLAAVPEIGAGIYGYRMALQALLAAGVMGVVFWGVFRRAGFSRERR